LYFHLTGVVSEPEKLAPYKDEEKRAFGELRSEGVVVHAFRSSGEPTIYLIVDATTDEEAREQMARLPYVAAGLLTFDYVEVAQM
jgi:muconolactone delta-isomerase